LREADYLDTNQVPASRPERGASLIYTWGPP